MRRVPAFSYRKLPFASDRFHLDYLDDYTLQQKLRIFQKSQESIGAYEGLVDLDRDLESDVKNLYIKGASSREVPEQVWNIETRHFQTYPSEFLDRFNIEFEEF